MSLRFSFSEEEEVFRSAVREFCSRYVAPRSREMFDSQRVPADLIALLGKQKLIAMTVPEEYGGANASWVMVAIAGEEIAYADMCGEGWLSSCSPPLRER